MLSAIGFLALTEFLMFSHHDFRIDSGPPCSLRVYWSVQVFTKLLIPLFLGIHGDADDMASSSEVTRSKPEIDVTRDVGHSFGKMDKNTCGSKGKVCVTGASGFVASWLIKQLLESGYRVVGTVRDPGNAKKVVHLWELEGAKERLELVQADLTTDGSFDNAVMGCDGVFHTASPVIGSIKSDPKIEILDPAIQGTLNVLRSCKKNPMIRRVVLTSSSSTVRVREDSDQDKVLDETCWSSVELCQRLQIWYPLAKVLAEKAAWEFAAENNINLVTVLPSYIVGPCLPRDLSLTASDVLSLFKGEAERFSWHGRMGYVHIDDVARCHILVYENPEAKGRYLCSSSVINNHDLGSLLAKRYHSYPIPTSFKQQYRKLKYKFDTSKMTNLGFKFRGIEEMFDDALQSLKEQGHLS